MENNGEKRTGKFLNMEITNEHQLQVIIMWSGFVQLNVNNLCGPAGEEKVAISVAKKQDQVKAIETRDSGIVISVSEGFASKLYDLTQLSDIGV